MKKTIGIIIGCILVGCGPRESVIEGDAPGTARFHQDTAPWPWVHIVPSERSTDIRSVSFDSLAHQIRFDMCFGASDNKFKKVRLVMLDYTILPHEAPEKKALKKKFQGRSYLNTYNRRPQRYFMTMSFYECDQKPPSPPLFEGTVSMRTDIAPPYEAFHLMAHEIILDHIHSNLKKLVVNLD
ncbi:MAG: hypothetical protein K2P93_01645 [Alphaproteobacteria bacterium]|nr:hypothetical protein [Alphaproteobacteria bacterium]